MDADLRVNALYLSSRLRSRLADAARYPVTTIIAPTGYGKTTAAQYLQRRIAAEAPDAYLFRQFLSGGGRQEFWAGLCRALHTAPQLSAQLRALGYPDSPHTRQQLLELVQDALAGKPLPVYGNGQQIRDWLYVEDHARALYLVATRGEPGETYNIGGHNERKNIEVVETICQLLEELAPDKPQGVAHYRDLIAFVADRPGHDLRYAIDASKIARELGWTPAETFTSGMRKTVAWYLANEAWWRRVQDGSYQGERLGLQS